MKNEKQDEIKIPRNRVTRTLLRWVGRLVVNLFFNLEIEGKENLPPGGPLIVVGNHTAIMEAVFLNVYSPWQIEMVGAADIPHEKISQIFSDLYGFIPVNRGHVDRPALRSAISVLEQRGIIGIFPEGGIWEPGLMRAQTGVAWLSYRGKTPVLPIGFSGTLGSIGKALRFKRPKVKMKIGALIPPLQMETGLSRKVVFEDYSERIMSEVRYLVGLDDPSLQVKIKDETFDLKIIITDHLGEKQEIPQGLTITHSTALAKFLHRPAVIKIFRSNLQLQIDPLEDLHNENDPKSIRDALSLVLAYLEDENPFLLSYRFGPKNGEEMYLGLKGLKLLTEWACDNELMIRITPIRGYFSVEENKEILQVNQVQFEGWM